MKVLLELRPALDGHAGIPQETRLLFRGLLRLEGVDVEGLLQSSNRVLARGIPNAGRRAAGLRGDARINKLSRVVVSLQRGSKPRISEQVLEVVRSAVHPAAMIVMTLFGWKQSLTSFEPHHFKDFVWRTLFSKTLPFEDFHSVTAARFRVARIPWSAMHASALVMRKLGWALYPRLNTSGFTVMISETPYPGRVSAGTHLVVRYHDAIPLLMPHTISDKAYHQASHYQALRRNVADGAWFACVSDATRQDLISIFPEAAPRAVTIHNMVSHHYHDAASSQDRIPEIIRTRRNAAVRLAGGAPVPSTEIRRSDGKLQYLLMVSTIEPRKNHLTLLAAWEQLRAERFPGLSLVLVGALGWDHKAIVKKFRPWLIRGSLHVLEDVPADELRQLYQHASATICPSFGEGFDFSGVEAMRCGGVVAASDIPVHRDIFGPASEYFSAYSSRDLAGVVSELIAPEADARREALISSGKDMSARYLAERILPQWQALLTQLKSSA